MLRKIQVVLFCLAGVAAVQGSAYGQTQASNAGAPLGYVNGELPVWLRFSGEERARVETQEGIGFKPAGNGYLLNRLRLNMDVAPVRWLRFSFQAQDARVFGSNVHPAPTSQRAPMDLRLGYVEIGKAEEGPITLRLGRQALQFGESRLISDPSWSNTGRSFDAARATLRFWGVKVDAFTGAAVKIIPDGFDTPTPGEHLHGVYGTAGKWVPGASIEPYFFWRLTHNWKAELGKPGNLDERTIGLRWVGKLPLGFDYGTEMVIQRGWVRNEPVSAWAGHWVAGYTLPDTRHRPRLFTEYNRATGDGNTKDGVHRAFDTMFTSAHDKFGLADQFCWENLVYFRPGFEYRVGSRLMVATAYNRFWLENARDGMYTSGKVVIASKGTQGRYIGQETDVQGQWAVSRTTQVITGYGRIFPGEFLRQTGHPTPFNSFFLGVTQRL